MTRVRLPFPALFLPSPEKRRFRVFLCPENSKTSQR
jgi:hypothetical protein